METGEAEMDGSSDDRQAEREESGFTKVFRLFLGTSYLLSAVALVSVTVVVLLQIFFRYVMGNSLVWAGEVARLTLVLITFWGLAWVDSRKSHLAIEFNLPDAVPNYVLQALYIVRSVATGAVALIVAYAAFAHARGLELSAPATGFSLSLHFYLIALGLLAWAIYRFISTPIDVIEMRKEEQGS